MTTIDDLTRFADSLVKQSRDASPVGYADVYALQSIACSLAAIAKMMAEEHKVEMMRHQVWIDNTFGEQTDPTTEASRFIPEEYLDL